MRKWFSRFSSCPLRRATLLLYSCCQLFWLPSLWDDSKTLSIAVTNPSFQTIRLPQLHPEWQLLLSPLNHIISPWLTVKFLSLLFNIKSIMGDDSVTLIETCCLLLLDQHHLNQLSPWAADFGPHFYSDCADDGGRWANASWTSIASVRAHWAHLRDSWETLPLPSILYSRLNLLPSGCLPGIRGKYCRGETSSLCFIQLVGRLAKKQSDTVPPLIYYSRLSIKALARASESFW